MSSTRVLVETRVSELRAGDLWLFDGAWVLLTEVTPAPHPDDRVQLLYRQAGETESEFTNPRGNEVAVVKREPSSTDRPYMVWDGSLEALRAWIERWVASPGDYSLHQIPGGTSVMLNGSMWVDAYPSDRLVRTEPVQGYAGIAVANHS